MHVLYVMGQSEGGLPHYTAELANSVAERAEVTVMKPTETTADGLFDDSIRVLEPFTPLDVSLPRLYSLEVNPYQLLRGFLSYDKLEKIHKIDADVVHVTTGLFPHVKFFSYFHDIGEHHPVVLTQHEVRMKQFPLSKLPALPYYVLDYLLPDVPIERVVVHTEKQREATEKKGTPPENIDVIPHGAYSIFGNLEDIDREPEENCVLFFGNVIPPKGIDTLVRAIPHVKQELPDVTLIIAGDGDLSAELKSIIDKHSKNFEVYNSFIPNEAVKEFFGRAQVAVMPYREQDGTKGHSGAMLTSVSFGTPVITSRAGEFSSQIAKWKCGTTVPSDEPEQLAQAIIRVLDDDGTRAEMAANSLRMAEELSWKNIAEKHLNLYEDVIRDGDQAVVRVS